jgi:hypothetical protein
MDTRIVRAFAMIAVMSISGAAKLVYAGSHDAIKEALEAKYQLTKTGIDRARITQPGTVFVIQKNGISGDLATDATFLNNKVIDGQVSQAGGFMAAMQDKKTSRILKPGDKVYLFKIEVKDDQVEAFVITCDTYDVNLHGSTRQIRYKAQLSFQLGKDFMGTTDAAAVEKAVEAVIVPESDVETGHTKKIDLDQTPDQVKSALGAPDKTVNLGSKTIFIYKDMKVVFTDGKVSDVQ